MIHTYRSLNYWSWSSLKIYAAIYDIYVLHNIDSIMHANDSREMTFCCHSHLSLEPGCKQGRAHLTWVWVKWKVWKFFESNDNIKPGECKYLSSWSFLLFLLSPTLIRLDFSIRPLPSRWEREWLFATAKYLQNSRFFIHRTEIMWWKGHIGSDLF